MGSESESPNTNEIKRIETVEHFAFLWSVNIPEDVDEDEDEEKITSASFSAIDRTWQLHLYPNSKDSMNKDSVGMDLTMTGETDVKVHFSISMFDQKKQKLIRSTRKRSWLCQPNAPFYMDRLIKLEFVDELTKKIHVLCEIWPDQLDNEEDVETEEESSKLVKMQTKNKRYQCKHFLNNNKCSDVKILIDNQKILAHSIVLAINSAAVGVILGDFLARKNKVLSIELKIKDVEYNVMMELIRYIYCGHVNHIEKIANKLMIAAFEYGVWDLINVCEMILLENLCHENAFEYLKSAVKCDAVLLKEEALNMLIERW